MFYLELKKLRNVGADLGSAIKSFKKSSKDDGSDNKPVATKTSAKQDKK